MTKNKNRPPVISIIILRYLLNHKHPDSMIGDFEEQYREVVHDKGIVAALVWSFVQIVTAIPSFFYNSIYWSGIMIKSYIKIAVRNIIRYKTFSFINITGLAVGLAAGILILLYVQYELSYDSFHNDTDTIYRIINNVEMDNNSTDTWGATPGYLAEELKKRYSEVIESTKLFNWGRKLVSHDDTKLYLERLISADKNFFNLFDFPLISGSRESVLNEPFSMVLTEETARRFYNTTDAIGKTLIYSNIVYKITGVSRNIPKNSHIQFDAVISWPSSSERSFLNRWFTFAAGTYIRISENSDPFLFESKIQELISTYIPNRVDNYTFLMQPLKDIHLKSTHLSADFNIGKGNYSYVYIFPVIAVIIIFIACFNFMNLSTARGAKRAKEVGLRKVVGADRFQIVRQILSETVLISLLSFVIAIGIVALLIPFFNTLSGQESAFDINENVSMIAIFTVLSVIVGLLAGSYPAFYLSSFQPVVVLKGLITTRPKSISFRKLVVIGQFCASIVLIICTLVVIDQINFVRNKSLGFDKEEVVVLNINDVSLIPNYPSFRNELLQSPNIVNVGASREIMGQSFSTYSILPEGVPEDEQWNVPVISVDYNFLPTMGIELSEGRNFSEDFPSDILGTVIINETLVDMLNWDSPIGKTIINGAPGDTLATVIGVAKDFHIKSLHQDVEPVVLYIDPARLNYITVRIKPENIPETLEFIESKWAAFDPGHSFEYTFLDDDIQSLYETEEKAGKLFSYFSALAVFISCLGLFGLVSFTAEQRTKEIGIRKVLGATVQSIVALLSKEFLILVAIANIAAWPIAYLVVNKWLQSFAYHIDIGIGIFVLSALLALTIALITVSFQAIKAALTNPVESIRYE